MTTVFCTDAPAVWGAETSLLTLLTHAPLGADDVAILTSPSSPLILAARDCGVRAYPHQFGTHPALERGSLSRAKASAIAREPLEIARAARRLRSTLRQLPVRPTHLVAFSTWQAPEVAAAGRSLRIPVTFDAHDSFSGGGARHLMRLISKVSTGTIAPSETLARNYGLKRFAVIPRPVATKTEAREAFEGGRPFAFGMFGQIAPHKGVLEAVAAFQNLRRRSDLRMLIVGASRAAASAYEEKVREACAADSRITFAPRTQDVAPLMRECEVIVNNSQHEAFGRTIAEGALAGCYPLVAPGQGPHEIVRGLGFGTVVEGNLSRSMDWALSRSKEADRAEIAARACALYAAPVVAEKYFAELGRVDSRRERQ